MISLLAGDKLTHLLAELSKTRYVIGSMAEVGVYKGGTAKAMREAVPDKKLHLYDTFKGIVKADNSIDLHTDGDFSDVGLSSIRAAIPDAVFHVGMFPDTFTEGNERFSFVHSDTDTYFGTKATLDIFSPIMSKGGIIIFDDWKWVACPGVVKAIIEFLDGKRLVTRESHLQFSIQF